MPQGPRELSIALVLALLAAGCARASCPEAGEWQSPVGERVSGAALFEDLAGAEAVLLGETHDRMAHHRWQLHTIAGLHSRRPDMVIGLEMLPRSVQDALDDWVAGELGRDELIEESGWYEHWGYDAELYLPILHFARMHRVPLKALNVERGLHDRLAEDWEAVPEAERYGIPAPAAPAEAYRERLEEVFERHPRRAREGRDPERFVRAQLVWDRVMAHGIAEAATDGTLVVALMGSGHVEHGHGVPRQLDDLELTAHRALLPWPAGAECEPPAAGVADAVFGIAANADGQRRGMRLGVVVETADEGVRIRSVEEGSVAAEAGLQEGDIILRAAGQALGRPADLVVIVRRQAPGTWLPLDILRDGEAQEAVARFPPPR